MKTWKSKTAAIFFIIPLFFASCSKTDDNFPTEPVPIDLTQQQVSLIESGNSFAFDIFNKVTGSAAAGDNIIISPLSISIALSMTVNGAGGATRDSILKALRLSGINPEAINSSYKDLSQALLSVDKRVLISIANSVWTENDFTVKQNFIDILTSFYDAESHSFEISDSEVPGRINAWIEDNTNGLIKNMVDRLEDNTVMLLINAIYFKGKWKTQFDNAKTEEMPFYRPGGSSVDVPMMRQKAEFKVYQGNGFVLAEFPYGQGNFVMDVILPGSPDGINNLIPSVGENFTGWVSQMTNREIELFFPRFKYGFKKKLKDVLTDMGMGIAFRDGADFSNISEQYDLLINDVTHQAFIETNEEGTEAAAATIVEIGVVSAPPPPLELKLDHPFIYIIRESTTNSILFMGRVTDPSVN